MFVQRRKNMFQLIQEADGDDILNTNVDQTTNNADPNAGEAESASDQDLDLNVDLNDDTNTDNGGNNDPNAGGGDLDLGSDDMNGDMDNGSTDMEGSTSTDGGSSAEGEVKKGNTDLFASLTAEEQSVKIMELKKLYNDLYSSTEDLNDKISNLEFENIETKLLIRVSNSINEYRQLLRDYIIQAFPIKTYYENDVQYSIFLNMLASIRGVFEDIYKTYIRNADKKN